MFWGTDITRMLCSWRQCVTLFTEELRWLKGRDLDLVMGEATAIGWAGASPLERKYLGPRADQRRLTPCPSGMR